MRKLMYLLAVVLLVTATAISSMAQPTEEFLREASTPEDYPLDDITTSTIQNEKRVLGYDHVRESDVLWKKRVWQVIDAREKMNKPFTYPERPLFQILVDAAIESEITVYSGEDDKFRNRLSPEEVLSKISFTDTIVTINPENFEERLEVVRNERDIQDIQRYRIKEMWYFDEELSQMKVRILGIAPMIDEFDDNGNFLYELPLFWIYYPDCRELLARERVYNFAGNDASPISWEDIFEMRFFSSYIYKESNVNNDRLKDYLSGVDLLLEADKIKSEIFNFEHDIWSY